MAGKVNGVADFIRSVHEETPLEPQEIGDRKDDKAVSWSSPHSIEAGDAAMRQPDVTGIPTSKAAMFNEVQYSPMKAQNLRDMLLSTKLASEIRMAGGVEEFHKEAFVGKAVVMAANAAKPFVGKALNAAKPVFKNTLKSVGRGAKSGVVNTGKGAGKVIGNPAADVAFTTDSLRSTARNVSRDRMGRAGRNFL